jgi:hypothetical protein
LLRRTHKSAALFTEEADEGSVGIRAALSGAKSLTGTRPSVRDSILPDWFLIALFALCV